MGQKVHPLGFRIGFSKPHSSYWYSPKKSYFSLVKEDIFIREFIKKNISDIFISSIEINRKSKYLIINIHTTKPSVIMGVEGKRLFDLRSDLEKALTLKFKPRDISLNVVEILSPDLNASLLAESMRQQLEKRIPFRNVMKSTIRKARKAGAKGIKVQISGRLNGNEIARTEWIREGQIPLHTLKANIDYYNHKALTLYGILGIKVWVYIV